LQQPEEGGSGTDNSPLGWNIGEYEKQKVKTTAARLGEVNSHAECRGEEIMKQNQS
jgi:hypothetical protein